MFQFTDCNMKVTNQETGELRTERNDPVEITQLQAGLCGASRAWWPYKVQDKNLGKELMQVIPEVPAVHLY